MNHVHTFTDDALGDLDALGVAARIRSGEVSHTEVAEAAIARVEKVNPLLNAVAFACADRARNQALTEGVFAGVPSFVKDNVDVAGLPTCHGSTAIRPRPARASAPPARQFLSQGFVLLGKTTLPEFGMTASTEYADRPPTRNPWNTDHSAGGSSGGSAALVASGAVPIAHANDGGGSIRIPAALNGLVGLKTTRRRLLDQPGVRQLPINMVSEGVLTRTVRDTAHYLAAAEQFHADPTLAPVGLVEGPGARRLRIGVIRHDILGRAPHPETEAVLDSAVALLSAQGHELSEARLLAEPGFIDDFKIYWGFFAILQSLGNKLHHGRGFQARSLDPFTRGLNRQLARRPHGLPSAVRRLRGATALYDRHFQNVDLVLTPVLAHPAPRLGEFGPDQPFEDLLNKMIDYVAFTPLNNVGGGPAIALPHHLTTGGLPGAIQLSAPRGAERSLLEIAYEFEALSPFPRIVDQSRTQTP